MTTRVVVNNTWTDLHPDDHTTRTGLRDRLRAHTRQRGIAEKQLATAAGHRPGWAQSIWAQDSWRLSSIQTMCRVLGYHLDIRPGRELPAHVKPADETFWLGIAAVYNDTPADRDMVYRMRLADTAARLRAALGLSTDYLGGLLGQQAQKVAEWETGEKPDYLFITAQRHFRALGYPLSFTLLDANGELVPEPAPGDVKGSKPTRDRSPKPELVAAQVVARNSLTFIADNNTVVLTVDGNTTTMPRATWNALVGQ